MGLLDNLTKNHNRYEDVGYLTLDDAKAIGVVGVVGLVDELGNQMGTSSNPIGVLLVDPAGAAITSLGGGGGAGGGAIVYTNAAEDFTATVNPGTSTITITGLPFTLEAKHVVAGSIKRILAAGTVSDVDLGVVEVAGGVITLDDAAVFATGTKLYMTLIGPDKHYDTDLDSDKNLVQNPNYAHYTDIENIISATNESTGAHRVEWQMDSYKYISLQIALTGGVTGTVWATNDSNADTTKDMDWVDVSSDVLGAAQVVDSKGIYFVDTPTMPLKYMLKYDCKDGINAIDVHLRRYY